MFLWVDTRCNEPMICSNVELRMALVSTFCTQNLTLLEKSSLKALRPSSRAIWEPVGLVAETGCSPILLNVHLFYSTNIQ